MADVHSLAGLGVATICQDKGINITPEFIVRKLVRRTGLRLDSKTVSFLDGRTRFLKVTVARSFGMNIKVENTWGSKNKNRMRDQIKINPDKQNDQIALAN